MNCYEKIIELNSRADCVYLRGFFDVHYWARACDEDKFKEDIEEMRVTPNMYGFLGGDMCDFVAVGDKRFDASTLHPDALKDLHDLPRRAGDAFTDALMPVKDRLLWGMEGNHEFTIHNKYNQNITNYICTRLGIPNLGYVTMVRLLFRRKKSNSANNSGASVTILAAHGFGAARGYTGKINRVIQAVPYFDADIYWFGHTHGQGHAIQTNLFLNKGNPPRVLQRNKLCIVGGSYLRTYQKGESNYAERSGYPPTPLGCETLKITPFANKVINGKLTELPPQIEINTRIETNNDY